jgi:hypothetical protein
VTTARNCPVDASQDSGITTTTLVAQNFASKNFGIISNSIPWQSAGALGATSGADAVCAMPVTILHILVLDERTSGDATPRKIGVPQVQSGVEDGNTDAPAAKP